jgi:hypothetical protein
MKDFSVSFVNNDNKFGAGRCFGLFQDKYNAQTLF